MSDEVIVRSADGVCEIRLNRPQKRNAITLAMYARMTDALAGAERDEDIRVILLSGEGASFSAGNDLHDFQRGPVLDDSHAAVRFLRHLPRISPVMIAAVQGASVGIGVTLLLHCDLVVASNSARLSMPFVKLGLVPEAASSLLLPRLVGAQRAAELLLLGEPIDAARACALGLVSRVVEDARLLEEARSLARQVAALPAGAVRATKRLLHSSSATPEARIEEELQVFRERLGNAEFQAAARAFFGKGAGKGAPP